MESLPNAALVWRVGLNRRLGRLVATGLMVPCPTFRRRPSLGLNVRRNHPLSIRHINHIIRYIIRHNRLSIRNINNISNFIRNIAIR